MLKMFMDQNVTDEDLVNRVPAGSEASLLFLDELLSHWNEVVKGLGL